MKFRFLFASLLSVVVLNGCGLEYGKVHAQFESSDIAALGIPYLDQKVTVRGTITEHALDESTGKLTMVLEDEVRCVWYGNRTPDDILLTAESYQVGRVASFDGYLQECEPGNVVLDPVHSRDSHAPFDPLEQRAD